MEMIRNQSLEDALQRRRAKQQLDKLKSFLNSISSIRFNGFIEEQDYRFDVRKAWGKAIRYSANPSSSIEIEDSREHITKWMIQRISFIEAQRSVLLSLGIFTLKKLSALEFFSDQLLIESIYNGLRITTDCEINFMLIKLEQSRLITFVETEHEVLPFEWTAIPEFELTPPH